jgi:hypothetical protein
MSLIVSSRSLNRMDGHASWTSWMHDFKNPEYGLKCSGNRCMFHSKTENQGRSFVRDPKGG